MGAGSRAVVLVVPDGVSKARWVSAQIPVPQSPRTKQNAGLSAVAGLRTLSAPHSPRSEAQCVPPCMGFLDPRGLLSGNLLRGPSRLTETCSSGMTQAGGSRRPGSQGRGWERWWPIAGQVMGGCRLTAGTCPAPLHLEDTTPAAVSIGCEWLSPAPSPEQPPHLAGKPAPHARGHQGPVSG